MRTLIGLSIALLSCMSFVIAQPPATLNLMPLPSSVQNGNGRLAIDNSFSVAIAGYSEPRLERAVARMTATLARETGVPFKGTKGATPTLEVRAEHASEDVQKVGEDESYDLTVTPRGAKLQAANPLGILRGLQTFLQLVELTPEGFSAPVVTIHDQPRFPWRGLMIDVSRHFMPLEVLKRNLDGMEAVKLNVLHLHLSDNQGFRIESKKYPKLQEMGSNGEYFTQEQMKDLIAYARDRGIRIMPEFETPGHSTAMMVGYPELGTAPPYSVAKEFGVLDPALDPTKESTYKFLDGLIGEMAGLFPDQYMHIGGDEVNGKAWDASESVQAFKQAHGLKDNAEVQAYFNKKLQAIVAKHHKTMVGWDEILAPELPKSIVIQSWRGPDSLADAARKGYHGLLSFGYYLDLYQSPAFHYENDPMSGKAAELNADEKKMTLGGEACMWTELETPENLDSRIWPRTAAIAERFWSPQEVRDLPSMYARIGAESLRLEWVGLQHRGYYRRMLERLVGSADIEAIQTLADVVQAPPEYARSELYSKETGHEHLSSDPYNRLVDATHPVSLLAERFSGMVEDVIAHKAKPQEMAELRELLTRWRDNDPKLQAQIQASFLLREVAPLSLNLSKLGSAGLQGLDYLERGSKPPAEWVTAQAEVVSAAKQPHAELLLAVAPSVEKLVQAASSQ